MLSAPMRDLGGLINDTAQFYGMFRDNLISLNHFGEMAWWDPDVHAGFPIYYWSYLGHKHSALLYTVTSFAFYVLGRLGVIVHKIYPFYVFYFAFLTPLFFCLTVLPIIRRIFVSREAILFVLTLTAFSPPVIFNLSDIGFLELAACANILVYAALRLRASRALSNYIFFAIALMLFNLILGFYSLFWAALYVPLFLAVVFFIKEQPGEEAASWGAGEPPFASIWSILSGGGLVFRFVLVVGILISVTPTIFTVLDNRAFIGSGGADTVGYGLGSIKSGTPLEFLLSSVPGILFEWTNYVSGDFIAFSYKSDMYLGYVYTGLLTLPLAVIGFIYRDTAWSTRLFVLSSILALTLVISAYGPVVNVMMRVLPFLKVNNHLSDALFRAGGSVILIFAAGLGFEAVTRDRGGRTLRALIVVFALHTGAAVGFLFYLYGGDALRYPLIAFFLAMTFFVFVLLFRGLRVGVRTRGFLPRMLIALLLLDAATGAFWFANKKLAPNVERVAWDGPYGVRGGSARGDRKPVPARILVLRNYRRYTAKVKKYKLNDAALPLIVFSRTLRAVDIGAGKIPAIKNGISGYIPVSEADLKRARGTSAATGDALTVGNGLVGEPPLIVGAARTYNRYGVHVQTNRETYVMFKSAHHPLWTARVNGKKVPIYSGFGVYQTVRLPAGVSRVEFRFDPWKTRFGLHLSYLFIVGLLGWWFLAYRKESAIRRS